MRGAERERETDRERDGQREGEIWKDKKTSL